jgi:hypothetical protein
MYLKRAILAKSGFGTKDSDAAGHQEKPPLLMKDVVGDIWNKSG